MGAAFLTDFEVRQLCDAEGRAVLTSDGRCQWAYTRPLVARDAEGFLITVPAIPPGLSDAQLWSMWRQGLVTTTDFASIPRAVWELLPPDGPWVRPAGIHDLLYKTRGTGLVAGRRWIARPTPYTRGEADRLLDALMAALAIDAAQRIAIFEGVNVGGAVGWGS